MKKTITKDMSEGLDKQVKKAFGDPGAHTYHGERNWEYDEELAEAEIMVKIEAFGDQAGPTDYEL